MHALARAYAEGARSLGAEVRLRRARELAPREVVARNAAWRAHLESTAEIPEATLEDLEWATGYAFGTPTRFGNISSQLQQFLDTTSRLWQAGVLADRPATGFTAS